MKPEPLKEGHAIINSGFSFERRLFEEKRIKSAVEWFLEKFNKDKIYTYNKEFIEKRVIEAFEDVIKK